MVLSEDSPIHFLDFPIDVLLHVLGFLEARWVLPIRQCCKSLCEVTRDRGLWIDLFRKVMEIHKVFSPTFKLDSMSQKELEDAALKPHRFVSSLLNFAGDELSQTRGWEIQSARLGLVDDPVTNADPDLWRFTDVQMVFGGRFVFGVYGARTVILWDFQTHPAEVPVASLSAVTLGLAEDERIVTKECRAAPDGRSIYLELIISDLEFELLDWSHGRRTQICKVNPFAAPGSVFMPFASREHHGRYDTVLRGTELVILGETSISVWDFEADRSISWEIGPHDDQMMSCYDNFCALIHYEEGEYAIWEIPPLADDLKGHIEIINEPKSTGDIRRELEARPNTFIDMIEPKSYSAAPILLTFVKEYPFQLERLPPEEILETYVVSVEKNPLISPDDQNPLILGLNPYSSINAPLGSRIFATFYATETARLVSLARSRSKPGICIYVRDHASGEDNGLPVKENTVRLAPTHLIDFGFFDFCPFSGRCALVSGGGGLHVYEYLS